MKKFFSIVFLLTICLFGAQIIHADKKTLKFGTEAAYPPFEYFDDSRTIQGFEVDVVKEICKRMKVNCTFEDQIFDSLITNVQLDIDDAAFGAISITEARKKDVDFSEPYFFDTGSFVANKATKINISPQGMQGKSIGVHLGTIYQEYLESLYGDTIKLHTYDSSQQSLSALLAGKVDAVMGDTSVIKWWLKEKAPGRGNYHIIGTFSDRNVLGNGYGIIVKRGNKELLQSLNNALKTMKADGALKRLQQKYFSQ